MAGTKQIFPMVLALAASGGCYTGIEVGGYDEITEMRNGEVNSKQLNTAQLNNFKLNDFKLNDFKLNDFRLNDFRLNNDVLNGVQMNDFRLNDFRLNGPVLEGSEFVGVLEGEQIERRGVDLIGAEIKLKVEGKDALGKAFTAVIVLRFDDIYLDENAPADDVYLYDITYRTEGGNSWSPLCLSESNQPVPVIPVSGRWDYATGERIYDSKAITLACTDAVIGKCVQWGYRPWGDAWQCPKWDKPKKCDLIPLQDHHQACTRMARADYCGDGVPWTVTGTPIDIWDHLYPQIEAPEADGWQIEAEWNTDGAFCLQDIRQQGWKAQGQYPHCKKKKQSEPRNDCGSLKDNRALLVSSFDKPPPPPKPKK